LAEEDLARFQQTAVRNSVACSTARA
jgi:hypothetical protein